uniref:Uncharacterized protein n=1 Tax=Anguilla anguilla TaxID=7936 RepID=A0A0E9WQP6_ANGAN
MCNIVLEIETKKKETYITFKCKLYCTGVALRYHNAFVLLPKTKDYVFIENNF